MSGGIRDNLITVNEVKATARAYKTEAEFFPGSGHCMMLDGGWEAVAARIIDWLNERNL